ncbi:30781_t:CDS:2, partial [Racocetra persica]
DHISEILDTIMDEWEIQDKTFIITTNNGQNVKRANIKKVSEYLYAIADCPTRWNSSYLTWNRLLKLKNYINFLVTLLSTKSDSDTKKDLKYLKKILLYDDKWNTINDLVEILQPFAKAINYLGGSNYCTYLIMVSILIKLKKKYQLSITNNDIIVETNDDDTQDLFDDDISDEEEKEDEQAYTPINIDLDKIKSNLSNAINYYWPDLTSPSSLLPSLLDPRCKNKEKKNSKTEVKSTTVKKAKSSILSSFKKNMPTTVEKISNYLKLEEIDIDCDPFEW